MLKKATGFTLIELLIVVAVVGILSAIVIPNAVVAIQKAKQKETIRVKKGDRLLFLYELSASRDCPPSSRKSSLSLFFTSAYILSPIP